MRILRLEIEGFGPFRDRQLLDFASAAAGGLLLISGRTGAGKSSLLDAVSFALYGAVPRYDGQVSRVRSDHVAPDRPTLVALEFEMGGERYRVERSPEYLRPAKRGGGMTTQKTEARLWRWDEDAADWHGLASRPVDVAAELGPVLRLTHQQFLQVVMLSQGGFQRFLRAADDERQATLRTLFQTGRFSDIEAALGERRRVLDSAVREGEARIEGLLSALEESVARDAAPVGDTRGHSGGGASDADPDPEESRADDAGLATLGSRHAAVERAVAGLEAAAAVLGELASSAGASQRDADAALASARALRERQLRLERAEAKRAELDAQADEIGEARDRLAAAERAARVAIETGRLARLSAEHDRTVARWDTSLAELRELDRELATRAGSALASPGERGAQPEPPARPEWPGTAGGDAPATPGESWDERAAELARERDSVARALGALADSREDERRLDSVLAESRALTAELDGLDSELAEHEAQLTALPERLASIRGERAALPSGREAVEQREADAERARAQRDAAAAAEHLAEALDSATRASAERARQAAAAAESVSALLARRIAGMAGEIAGGLEQGSPCPVCGSEAHPAPAERGDLVTQEAIEAAETAQRDAQTALEAARVAERGIEHELAAARAGAGGLALTAAEEALVAAGRAIAEARESAERAVALDAQLSALEHERTELGERVAGVRERAGSARSAIAARAERAAELRADLAEARAGYDSIAARVADLDALHGALDALLSAGTARSAAAAATAAGAAAVSAALLAEGFAAPGADAETLAVAERASVDAQLSDPERAALDARVRDFDERRQRNLGELESPELRELDREPVALDELTERAELARTRAEAALTAHASAERIAAEHRATVARLSRELAGSSAAGEELLRLRRLADTVQGKEPNTKRMRLEVFVLAARLEAIVEAANLRLARMVGGRYRLAHDDGLRARGKQSGLGLAVIDEYTGRSRTTDSLSGGESFLASLALALGLADVVTAESGGLELDTLFIDEGFGSLDPDALDQALATLDGLREGGRTVALISHVAELKERLAGGLEVVVDGRGVSRLRGDGVLDPDGESRDGNSAEPEGHPQHGKDTA